MKRTIIPSMALLSLFVGACGPAELILTAEVEVTDPETGQPIVRAVEDLELQLLPFDRDQIFDSLIAVASSPEPALPPELQVARDSIAQAQQEWRESEGRWLALRERLEQINSELTQYNPAEARYRVLFNEFNEVESDYASAESTKDEAFARFDRLQQEAFSDLEEFRAILNRMGRAGLRPLRRGGWSQTPGFEKGGSRRYHGRDGEGRFPDGPRGMVGLWAVSTRDRGTLLEYPDRS